MPVTLAHPAAILPLPKLMGRFVVPSALVVGSIAPDLSYVLPLQIARAQSHSLSGVLWFCLPVGLAALVIWNRVMQRPLLALLPNSLRCRLGSFSQSPIVLTASRVAAIVFSIGLGALTHIGWDSLTHKGSPLVNAIAVMRVTVFSLLGYAVPFYKMLQHASSIGGSLLVVAFLFPLIQRRDPDGDVLPSPLTPVVRMIIIAALLVIPLVAGLIIGWAVTGMPHNIKAADRFAHEAIFSTFTVFVWLTVLYAAFYSAIYRRV